VGTDISQARTREIDYFWDFGARVAKVVLARAVMATGCRAHPAQHQCVAWRLFKPRPWGKERVKFLTCEKFSILELVFRFATRSVVATR
jgi:hypothetical protein